MTFLGPGTHRIPSKFTVQKTDRIKHRFTTSLIIILLLTSMFVVILPVSNVTAQPDGFEYFVHAETSIQRVDDDMDGYFEMARIYYDVDSTTVYAEIKVICTVTEKNTTKVVKEISDTYTIFRNVDFKETYFDFRTSYSGSFNFTLTVYDVVHNHQEYGGNDYPAGSTTLEVNPYVYRIYVDATAYDADADGYNDDVRIKVSDTFNYSLSDVPVYVDGEYQEITNQDGLYFDFNLPQGIHEVDVFYAGLHGNTDFKSEGTGQQAMIYADADPMDDDRDGYFDDVLIRAYAYNYYPLPNADVYIDWMYYGTTNQDGLLYANNFQKGFHEVFVTIRRFQTFTTFYAEALNQTDLDEFFFQVDARVVALEPDALANDLEIYLDVDVRGGGTSNVTVNATLYYENQTVAALGSITYTTTGSQVERKYIYIYNLTNNLTYNLKCELFDEQGNLEDVWYQDGIVVQAAFENINIDSAVYELNNDNHINDVIFWAHIKNEEYSLANIKVYWKSNKTMAKNLTTSFRGGYAVAENMMYANYTWTAYDSLNNIIDNGTFELYNRNPFRTVQISVGLIDDDFDNFYDDFEVVAYNEQNQPNNNVSVTITHVETNQVVAQGFTNLLSPGGPGRFLVEDLQEGYYTYSATILFGLSEFHVLSTGWFYSYGNSTESTHNLNAFAVGIDLDSDGYKNDAKVTVKDRNEQPVMNAIVFFDNDVQTQDTTDQNGIVYAKDFALGWHDVNVVFLGASPTVPPGSQAYTRFYSEGLNYDEFFWGANAEVYNADDDDEWNDLNVTIDVGINENVEMEVTIEIEIHYSSNDTLAKQQNIKYLQYNNYWNPKSIIIYNLTYYEKYYANYTLKDKNGLIEDEANQTNILLIPIKPIVNVELYIFNGSWERDLWWNPVEDGQLKMDSISFYAHILRNGIENITIEVYYTSNNSKVTDLKTDSNGYAEALKLQDDDYYFKAKNVTGTVEYGEFKIGEGARILEFESDVDDDNYYDDFGIWATEINVSVDDSDPRNTFISIWSIQTNVTLSIYDLNNNQIAEGNTNNYNWSYIVYNLTESYYKYKTTFNSLRITNGTFYSYGNGFENQPPIVKISKPPDSSNWNTTETIQFDGTTSYDPDIADTIRFYWESNISGPLGYKDSFTRKLIAGIHEITVYVDDGHGHNVSDSVTISVVKPTAQTVNQKPTADAGPDQNKAPVNKLVTLDGSGSSDPDGHIIAYNWSVVSKPSGANAQLNDSTYVKPTFTPNKLGLYRFSLGVQDNNSEWSLLEDTVDITVIQNQVPVVNISTPAEMAIFNTTDKIFFLSNGTYDPDDDMNGNGAIDGTEQDNLTYHWIIWRGNESVFELSGKGKPSFNSSSVNPALPAASYIINLTVKDDLEANASTDVEINITNVPPVINITSPLEGQMFRKYKSAKLDGSATLDADNETSDLYFYWEVLPKDKTPIIFANISIVNVDLIYEGDYTITLWVDDNMGADMFDREHNVSAVVNITVENQAPIADARLDHANKINLGETAYFNASRSRDPDDLNGANDKANFTYEWDLDDTEDSDDDGNYTNDKDLEGIVVSYLYDDEDDNGTHIVTLMVSDGSDYNDTAVTNLTLIVNTPPDANAGPDIANALVDTKILLDGSKSSDGDRDTLWYTWVYDATVPDDTSVNSTSPFANATYELPGTYTAILNVFDGMAWDTDDIVILVSKSNTAPICIVGKNIIDIDVGQTVYFSGINCSDMDDDELTYTWDFGDGTTRSGLEVTHEYDTNGVYTVTLNITDGEAYANDTLTVTVRPQAPKISEPDDGDTVKNTVIISGTTTGPDITIVEVKIGSNSWDDAVAEDDDWSTWSYDWDTTDEDNEEFEIQVRAVTSYATSAIASINVDVLNEVPLEITITSHNDNAQVTTSKVTIRGTATGEGITSVEIRIGSGAWEMADDDSATTDYSQWSYLWDTAGLANKRSYTITVRATTAQAETAEDSITLRLNLPEDTTPDEDGGGTTDIMAWIQDNIMLVAGGIILIILILIILIAVTRSGAQRRRLIEEEEAARRRDEVREEKERLEVIIAEEEVKKMVKKQPVRCPKCKEYSVIEDDGQRPLMIECVHCGANGYISERPKTLGEPKLPKEEEKLIIQCPKCDEMFTIEDEAGEIVCPSCGVRGQLDEETIAELKRQQAEEAGAGKAGETPAKEEEKKPEKTEKTIKCPNCDTRFNIPIDADSITCPSCGVSGTL